MNIDNQRNSRHWNFILAVACSFLFFAPGWSRDLPKGFEKSEMMSVSEVKPGMKGHLRTVYSGTKLEHSDVEILGIFPGFMAGRDIIIARLDIPFPDMGVIAGMSGSPVFINDRMIGAVAYGWSFSQAAIAGITPIEYMMEVYDQTKPKDENTKEVSSIPTLMGSAEPLSGWRAQRPWFSSIAPAQQRSDLLDKIQNLGLGQHDGSIDIMALQPLGMPLSVSSQNTLVLGLLEQTLGTQGLFPVSAGASGTLPADYDVPTADDIVHGSAVGVSLMTGDLNLAGIGTVTYRKGDKLVAFGHPMMMEGDVDMPMTSAVITTVVPSYMRPFKLGYPGKMIGTVRRDTMPAIGGLLGKSPSMIPFTIHADIEGQKPKDFNYEIVRHKQYTPLLTLIGIMETLNSANHAGGKQTANINYTLTTADGEKVSKEMFFSTQGAIGMQAAFELYMDAMMLLMNPYQKMEIASLDFDIKIRDTLKEAQLWAVRTNRDEYYPGQKVKLALFFQPWRDKMFVQRHTIDLPEDLRPGDYTLRILSGNNRAALEAQLRPGLFQMRDYDDVVRILNVYYPNNKIFLVLQDGAQGITIDDQQLNDPPPSIKSLIDETALSYKTAPINGIILEEVALDMEYDISGSETIKIKVEDKPME